jgi:two-component system phosphate regulon sensor histidine kinase PhoR
MLGALQTNTSSASLPVISRLRQEIASANRQRAALQKELDTREQLFQVAPVGYLQVDEENRLLGCNEQARQLLQIERWEPGQLRLLLEVVRSYELDQLIEKTRHQQQSQCQEWAFYPSCLDGETMGVRRSLTLRATCWPLPYGQIGVFLENRQPLVELTESRNRWVSDLAHELRTPLTSIRLVAEALQGRLEPPLTRWVNQMLQETNRLILLVEDWLEISQLEKDPSQHLNRQPLELRELIVSAWQTLEPLSKQKAIALDYSGPEHLYLQGDKSRLTQVFLNLFDNGIKNSPTQGAIRVEVDLLPRGSGSPLAHAESESMIKISMIDSGGGFSESDLPHVFDRLYRGDISRRRYPEESEPEQALPTRRGSGLGLAIVQQILQAHGGSIQARNHPETGGAWLQLELPQGNRD